MNIASQSKLKWRTDSPCCVHVNYSDTLSHRNGLIICHMTGPSFDIHNSNVMVMCDGRAHG